MTAILARSRRSPLRRPASSPPLALKTIRNLDGVRGFAVLFVVFFHLHELLPWGWMGVQLFFVLSGFLISGILLESRDQPIGGYLRRFYVRRVLRIFPLYFGYLAVLAIVLWTSGAPRALGDAWPWLCSFLYNWTRPDESWQLSRAITHLWSISVEEQFYFVWPFVVYFAPRRVVTAVALLTIALCPLWRWWLALHYQELSLHPYTVADAVYWNTFAQVDAFAFGALIATVPANVRARVSPHLVLALGVGAFLIAGIGAQLLLIQTGRIDYPVPHPVTQVALGTLGFPFPLVWCDHHVWGYTVIDLLFAAIVWWAVSAKETWLLCNPLIVEIGRVSFGMYVLHHGLIDVARTLLPSIGVNPKGALGVAIYLLTLFCLSRLVFAFWERPFLRMKSRLAP